MLTVVFGWLPMVDLPLPLVVMGGLILAIASNRMDSSQSTDSIHSSLSSKADAKSPSMKGVEQSRQSMSVVQSPSLPNLEVKRDRPISPKISPKISSQQLPTPASVSANAKPSSPTNRSSASTDPQLPDFVSPPQKKKKRVSFTIEHE